LINLGFKHKDEGLQRLHLIEVSLCSGVGHFIIHARFFTYRTYARLPLPLPSR
jgi:hypothetical protein